MGVAPGHGLCMRSSFLCNEPFAQMAHFVCFVCRNNELQNFYDECPVLFSLWNNDCPKTIGDFFFSCRVLRLLDYLLPLLIESGGPRFLGARRAAFLESSENSLQFRN